MNETWKMIPDISGYEVSDLGHVRKAPGVITFEDGSTQEIEAQLLECYVYDNTVSVNFLSNTYHVHRLVAQTFCDDLGNKHVRFKDGNRMNVALSNLMCVSRSQSVKDDIKNGIRKNPNPYQGVCVICNETGEIYKSIKQLAERLKIPRSTVRRYIHNQKPLHGFTYSVYRGGKSHHA